MSDTVTEWEAGCDEDGWWGHYSTAQALVRAITELGWEEPNALDCAGPILTLALFDLSTMGPTPAEGSSQWLEARLLEEQATALAQRDGWTLEEDLPEILADELEQAEDWLNAQPQTPEGHYWGHHPAGGVGWGLWETEEEWL